MKPKWAVLGWTSVVLVVVLLFLERPSRYPLTYNLLTEVTIRGVVQQVREPYCPTRLDKCAQSIVQTEKGTIEVEVAPQRFLADDRLEFRKGDRVEVVGAKITHKGRDELIACKIVRGNEKLVFRTPQGRPLWVK